MLSIVKYFLRFLVIVTFILGIVSPVLTPLSKIAFWNMTWERVLILIFLIAGMIIYIQIENENRKRPSIKIKPVISDQTAKLEILNNGGISQFSAIAKIVKNHHNVLNATYILCCDQGGYKVEIGKGGIGTIIIADQSFYGSLKMPVITSGEKKMINIALWPHDEWNSIQTDKPPDDVYLEISITAGKNMRKKFSGMIFKLSQESITNLKFEYMESKARKLKLDKYGYLK
jgi:hypothetical protein